MLKIPFEDYVALDGVNHSAAKAMADSPLAYRWACENPSPDSSSKRLGRVTHTAILEPDLYTDSVVVLDGDKPPKASGPEWDAFRSGRAVLLPDRFPRRAGNEYKAFAQKQEDDGFAILTEKEWDKCQAWSDYLDKIGGRTVIPRGDGEFAENMRDAVRGDAAAMRYLSVGRAELSLQWTERTTGLLCKSRIDWLTCINGSWVLVDLKTARSIVERDLSRAAAQYGWHTAMAFYHDALAALGIQVERVVMIVVCSRPPHDVGVFEVGEGALEGGREAYQGWLRSVKRCRELDEWPGRYKSQEQILHVPDYAEGMESDDIGFDD